MAPVSLMTAEYVPYFGYRSVDEADMPAGICDSGVAPVRAKLRAVPPPARRRSAMLAGG